MEENKYAESDKKCCEWLDKALNEKNITLEKQELLLRLKKFMKESISEDLKLIRGKYLVFIKDKTNYYSFYEHIFSDISEIADLELEDPFLFFIPTETEYSTITSIPYRYEIVYKTKRCKCTIS